MRTAFSPGWQVNDMRHKNFFDLNPTEMTLLRNYVREAEKALNWTIPGNSLEGGHFLRCDACQKSVAFIGIEQHRLISQKYIYGYLFYMAKRYYMPHLQTAEHKYAMTLKKLAVD